MGLFLFLDLLPLLAVDGIPAADEVAGAGIDLRVDKGQLKGLVALGALYADLEDGLGKKLDLLTTSSLDQKFLQHISSEEILIYYRIQN